MAGDLVAAHVNVPVRRLLPRSSGAADQCTLRPTVPRCLGARPVIRSSVRGSRGRLRWDSL
jgi:hypothetical protein